jgi:hypothetical protein
MAHDLKNKYIFSLEMRNLPSKGASFVQFLINKFSIFGIDVQNWMIIVAALVAAFAAFAWLTRERM